MKINYKKAYLELFDHILKLGVMIYDTQIHGPGVAFDLRFGGPRRIICIDGKLSWKKRLFVLMHEIGHIFYFNNLNLKFRKEPGSEVQANKTAVKLIKVLTSSPRHQLHREYASYYNSFAKNSSRAKFVID